MSESNKLGFQPQLDLSLSESKRTYSPPHLVKYGDLRGLTLGGSPGIGDSGSPTSQKPFTP